MQQQRMIQNTTLINDIWLNKHENTHVYLITTDQQ